MIIEGLLACDDAGLPHISAIGPVVNEELTEWTLRPYQSSRMFSLLRRTGRVVFHVTDDVLPIVQLMVGDAPSLETTSMGPGLWRIDSACRWFELEIESWNVESMRSEARAVVRRQGELRPFWGWNRAKHALLEAAVLISRAGLLDRDVLLRGLAACASPIEKTAGPREQQAWELIRRWQQAYEITETKP
ncbi:MAG: DUF447 family protein [Pirellulales bacterium]